MKNRKGWALFLIVGLSVAAALIASPAGAWLLHPVTPVARDVRTLFYKAVAITAFFFIVALVWTAIPTLAMVVLSGPAFSTMKYMETIPKSDVQIEVVGHQWFWEYRYPKYGVIFANEPLVVPAGKIISANVTSIDVVHSWFVPDFGIKMDANPGRINHVWFQVDHPGTFEGQCAELCGVLHGKMFITVNVVTPEEFERWIEQKKKGV